MKRSINLSQVALLMAEKGIHTRADLAQRSGISYDSLNRLFLGEDEVSTTDLEIVEKVCAVLGCNPGDMLESHPS